MGRPKGTIIKEETRKKISESVKKSWNKARRLAWSKYKTGGKLSEETKRKIGESHKGRKWSKEHNKKLSESLKGRKLTQKHKDNIASAFIGRKNHQWKGGRTSNNRRIRRSVKFATWRNLVFERDDYTCQDCGERGCELHPHHIIPLSEHPEMAYDEDNGITLCVPCHRLRHGWKTKSKISKKK